MAKAMFLFAWAVALLLLVALVKLVSRLFRR